jgi:hypothetical protein
MRTAILAVALAVALPVVATAQEPVRTFDLLNTRLKIGDSIMLSDTQGREIKGKIGGLFHDSVRVDTKGTVQEFRAERVGAIQVMQKDRLVNGVLWGAAAGFGLGAFSCAANPQCIEDESGAGMTAALGLLGAAAGAGIGAAIDAATKSRRVVYRAPGSQSGARLSLAPILTARRTGVAVSLSF